jgi:hypothetical protein
MQARSGPIVEAPYVGRIRPDIVLCESGSQVALIGVCGWCCADVDSRSTGNCRFCGSPLDSRRGARWAAMETGGQSQSGPTQGTALGAGLIHGTCPPPVLNHGSGGGCGANRVTREGEHPIPGGPANSAPTDAVVQAAERRP